MDTEAKPLCLTWTGPFSWTGETDNLFECAPRGPGIYAWALPLGDAYLPYYVGETGVSLATRSREHVQCYCSGMYTIYDAAAFKEGRKQRVWKGTVYSAAFGTPMTEFVRRLPELATDVHGMLEALRVFFAPLDLDDRKLRRVEGEVARLLAQAPAPYGTFQEEGLTYQRRISSERPLLVTVVNAPKGFVLPESFEA